LFFSASVFEEALVGLPLPFADLIIDTPRIFCWEKATAKIYLP
jgi:hypothetical protein